MTHQVVSEWRKAWRAGGRAALREAGRAGRRRKLSTAELAKVERALAKGAAANGYVTDLWTCHASTSQLWLSPRRDEIEACKPRL